jgi:hypothetical protein
MKSEKGAALPLVLIAVALGALVIPSFLSHTGTSLIGSRTYAQEINVQYAADSGAEQAIWNLKYGGVSDNIDDVGDNVSYQLDESINDLPVTVNIIKTAEPHLYSITSSAGDRVLNASVNVNGTAADIVSWYFE